MIQMGYILKGGREHEWICTEAFNLQVLCLEIERVQRRSSAEIKSRRCVVQFKEDKA